MTCDRSGANPGFQVRGGAHLKKLRRAEGGAKIFGVFRVNNHDFTPKNHIFSNFRGAHGAPPHWIRPCRSVGFSVYSDFLHNKTSHHDITEIFLKVALNTITLTLYNTGVVSLGIICYM